MPGDSNLSAPGDSILSPPAARLAPVRSPVSSGVQVGIDVVGIVQLHQAFPCTTDPGGGTVLNPLDPGAAGTRLSPTELFHRNLSTLRALIEATLGRTCRQLELVVLTAALARVSGLELHGAGRVERHGQTATLVQLAEALIDPPAEVASRANMPPGRVLDESREMALAIGRLVDPHGDLGGMFAG
ncbi:MAG: hypothetical protein M1598_05995, partial [Actinobacteria bacterium]|nr:hypothetical protein [Actinomycetota bacterium]